MKIKLFSIPNIITLANLICGVMAIREVLVNQNYTIAFWLVILAAVFDFFDGFVARLLSQQSPIGVQLDSLSDLISFGLAPTFVLFSLAVEAPSSINSTFFQTHLPFVIFVMAAFSALRLAKFNIDDSQHDNFVGLPTPANALLCCSVGLICQALGVRINMEWLVLLSVVMSIFMIAPLRMFSLKFKGFGWDENRLRYCFLALAVVEIVTLRLYAIAAIIISYILISSVVAFVAPSQKA